MYALRYSLNPRVLSNPQQLGAGRCKRLPSCLTAFFAGLVFAGSAHASKFDCASAYLAVDFVICSSGEVTQATERLGAIYDALRSKLDEEQKQALLDDERAWIQRYPRECGLKQHGRPDDAQIAASLSCVFNMINERMSVLQAYELKFQTATTSEAAGKLDAEQPATEIETYAKGLAALNANDCGTALKALQQVKGTLESDPAFAAIIAQAYECTGNLSMAVRYYRVYAAQSSDQGEVQGKIGELLYKIDKDRQTQQK